LTQDIAPTLGFQIERFEKKSFFFLVYDMSGTAKYRNLWEHYYKSVDAIVFVVDASDKIRMSIAKSLLEEVVNRPGSCF
jgi:GTPase SAR1 family protein